MIPALHSIGRVAGKHGFSGEIFISLELGIKPDAIKKGNFLFIEFDGKGVPFLIEHVKQNTSVVKLKDVNTIEDAAELDGHPVFLTGLTKTETKVETDVLGFVLYSSDVVVGVIKSIESYPAGPMFLVKSETTEILIPIVEDWILEVNNKKKVVHMELPEGLIDL